VPLLQPAVEYTFTRIVERKYVGDVGMQEGLAAANTVGKGGPDGL
jgi:hypothetical protein